MMAEGIVSDFLYGEKMKVKVGFKLIKQHQDFFLDDYMTDKK